jgi:hypothetical protein
MEIPDHPNATSKHLDTLVNDSVVEVRAAVARSQHATKEHLDRLIDDKDYIVRLNAMSNSRVSDDQLQKSIENEGPELRDVAKTILHLRSTNLKHIK